MKKTTTAYFLLGSNIGDRAENLSRAADFLEKSVGQITRRSSLYETEPWGKSDQNWFFNQAIVLETSLAALDILQKTKAIENEMGRATSEKNGPRVIDIDLLFFGNERIETPELTVPHPEIQNRNFTLLPLMEIAGDFIHPTLGQPIEDLYMSSRDPLEVILLEP